MRNPRERSIGDWLEIELRPNVIWDMIDRKWNTEAVLERKRGQCRSNIKVEDETMFSRIYNWGLKSKTEHSRLAWTWLATSRASDLVSCTSLLRQTASRLRKRWWRSGAGWQIFASQHPCCQPTRSRPGRLSWSISIFGVRSFTPRSFTPISEMGF